jgi:uncharacterized protein YjbI with pentapeptide repeats
MALLEFLEAGRADFRDATKSLSPAQALIKPAPESWSVLECVEHVVTVEERFLGWVLDGKAIDASPNTDKELRLLSMMRSRLRKGEAPEAVRPAGRFKDLATALREFDKVRDRTIKVLRERGESLYTVGAKHFFFGDLNGIEVIHLIDGHSRRHAEQIREICESLPKAAPKTEKTKSGFKRDCPDLPSQLEAAASLDDSRIEEKLVKDVVWKKRKSESFRIEASVLERVHFSESEFGSLMIKDSRLQNCDLSNVRAHRVSLVRVELIDCRLTGFHATAADWQDVLIQGSDLRYAQLPGAKFRTCEFDDCTMLEAGLEEADLSGCVIRSSKLGGADLRKTKLANTDFRKSEIEGMLVEMNDLQGAIVDPAQAMVLARVLGLQIK